MTQKEFDAKMSQLNADYYKKVQGIQGRIHELKLSQFTLTRNYQDELEKIRREKEDLMNQLHDIKVDVSASRAALNRAYLESMEEKPENE